MAVAISAIGTAVPKYKSPQLKTVELLISSFKLRPAEIRLLRSIYRASGIEYRHSVLSDYCSEPGKFEFFPNETSGPFPSTAARMKIYKQNARDLALAAIEDCLQKQNTAALDFTHLITVSCTGMYAPGLDIDIVNALAMSSSTKRTAVNFMGCYGAFNALKLAYSICKADADAKVLIVSVEICTIHFQNNFSLDNIVSNAIFSDGAAAVIVETVEKNQTSLTLENFHCDLIPAASDQMAWEIADNGFDIVLSSYVADSIKFGIDEFLQKLLTQVDFKMDAIDFFAIHPGGIKILEGCEHSLNITKEQNRFSYNVLRKFGNMSSATVLFVLKEIMDSLNEADDGKNIFSCAFGPGLTLESMLLKAQCG
jgi:alpha-pyrone synthase